VRRIQDVNRRGIALMTSAHVVDDLYQGAVPALLPFLVAERHYSYTAVAGLTLAATVLSSVAQPAFGWWADRSPRRWLIPVGILTAATGIAFAGFASSYLLTWLVIALAGLGIAAFHPEAARAARQAAGDNNRAMSVFAVGGNGGYALGSLVATPVLLVFGLHGTALLVVPAIAMAILIVTRLGVTLDGPTGARRPPVARPGADDWPAFLRLTGVVVVRAILFAGVTSFVALYFIHRLKTSTGVGNTALTTFLVAGACGTLLGGWIADRTERLTAVRVGFAFTVPTMIGLVLAPNVAVAFVFTALAGLGTFIPFGVFVMLGQDYLPNRIGTASGLTVGLAASVGGLFTPPLGWLADHTSLRLMLSTLVVLPAIALGISMFMRDPRSTSAAQPQPAAVAQ
jgi:FSR family fosmidomycin resistance protein-like MFS transporter